MAPGSGQAQVAAMENTTRPWPAANERTAGRAHRSAGSREPTLGLYPHPGRAAKARYPRLGQLGPKDPASPWSRTCSTEQPDLDGVLDHPGSERAGDGLLHGGHRVAQAALRALRYRTVDKGGAHPRCHRPSDRCVRHPGGPQPGR
jgi:hypothetical protein